MDYIAIIHKDDDSDYGVSFPDFSGCISAGRSLDEAKDMALEGIDRAYRGYARGGLVRACPVLQLDEVMSHPDFHDGVAFLVTVKEPETTVRVNITMTERQLQKIDQQARAQGMSRSAFLVKSGLKMG